MKPTLIIVDVQNDFCPGGALATARGDEVAEKIAGLVPDYDTVIATQDWHIEPEGHFSENPDFVDTWPVHCVAETEGAAMHPALAQAPIAAFFRKGAYTAAYSGFEGEAEGIPLAQWLREHGHEAVDIVGIATDHCVLATARDALKEGLRVRVLREYCSPVDDTRGEAALESLAAAGAEII
ncbi:isochorismatase family protein [Corynebacterium sp.]|uniref:isochorismatase family protein n=1 Tax=Corynebacterium sp. TaxID=1720 RepID=UPI0026DD4DA9|nr:isochorismatase family protein [Corynebacterium sp.]MDO5031352.1 isochorismatase family protein [Corynebacterium sp.]